MKFSALITSFAIYGAISGNSIYTGDHYDINKRNHNYPRYDIYQSSKLPKDQFIKNVSDAVYKIQKPLGFSYDFQHKLENLNDQQKQQLDTWWTQIASKYQQYLPTDPEQLKQYVGSDLKESFRIVYQSDPNQVIDSYK